MNPHRSIVAVALAMTYIVGLLPLRAEASEIEQKFKADYQDKVLTLRRPYEGHKLRFDSKGQVLGHATAGPWTMAGQINIREIHLNDRTLELKGQRVRLAFDAKTERMKDVITISASDPLSKDFREFGSKGWRKFQKDADVEVDLALASVPQDEMELASAMNAVFLKSDDDLADFVPDYWKDFVLKQEGKPPASDVRDGIYKVGHGVSPPRATFPPDPEYSDPARAAGFGGVQVLWLIVSAKGSAENIRVVKPLGLGLDEKAVQAVSKWKFEPARKDGSPVAVQINVEVSFRLY